MTGGLLVESSRLIVATLGRSRACLVQIEIVVEQGTGLSGQCHGAPWTFGVGAWSSIGRK